MKRFFLILTVLILASMAGYWSVKGGMQDVDNEKPCKFKVKSKTNGLGQVTLLPGPGSAPFLFTYGWPSCCRQESQEEARVFNIDNPIEKEQLTASLRQANFPEEEISMILKDSPEHKVPQEEGHFEEFRHLEREARENNKGLWK